MRDVYIKFKFWPWPSILRPVKAILRPNKMWQNTKLPLSHLPLEIEWFRRNCQPPWYLSNILYHFWKMFKKCQLSWFFKFLPNVANHKIASISLTIGYRVISSKFWTPRVSKQYTKPTFGKFFKSGKIQNCLFLLNHWWQSDFIEIFDPQGVKAIYYINFWKICQNCWPF